MNIIELEFEKITKKYNLESAKKLILDANIKLLYFDLPANIGGCTVSNCRCNTIIVNQNWSESLINFVILHEFSHLKLHKNISTPFFKKVGLNNFIPKFEREANQLAIKLLIKINEDKINDNLTRYDIANILGINESLAEYIC